jgi:predicted alpha-1,6-mannanase (GH76 family)
MAEPNYRAWAAAGAGALQRWYKPSTGRWRTTGWWNAANALTAVIGYTRWTGDPAHAGAIRATFAAGGRRRGGFINRYYDDNGWWGLAWVAAFDLTGDPRYLATAEGIFAHNTGGWDGVCRGGMWWNTARKYKNAITSELFLTLAARLHQRAGGGRDDYLAWALRAWEWFSSSGLIGPSGLVNDGLTASCVNNGRTTWTYNQGVILGGLAALYEITGDRAYLAQGDSLAGVALSRLASPPSAGTPGILTEPHEHTTPRGDRDRPQFKGIFMRNLCDFYAHSGRPAYREFILRNASSLWLRSKNTADQFGLCWAGPFDRADASRQSSALDVLNAAVAVTSAGWPGPRGG